MPNTKILAARPLPRPLAAAERAALEAALAPCAAAAIRAEGARPIGFLEIV